MAGLLALIKHRTQQVTEPADVPSDVESRIANACREVDSMLQSWNVMSTSNVGFEIIVPALLDYLGDEGIYFHFPGHEALISLRLAKLAKFDPIKLYETGANSLLHSLEAFIGKMDFDRISHHANRGSMLASPASTAAYLINITGWDDDAEAYLRAAVENCEKATPGGVPSAFPTSVFEVSWVLSTLLLAGYTSTSMGDENVSILASFLEQTLADGKGTVGFAPGYVADADDSAKAQLSLSLLGRKPQYHMQMVNKFDCGTHFETYPSERDPSVSTNCNVLMSLLHSSDPALYSKSIGNAVKFLCDAWDQGAFSDKWNLSPHYVFMLLSQAFVRLLRCWANGDLKALPSPLIRERVPTILLQILHRTLQAQLLDGSWDTSSCEPTSYAILTLASISSLPWFDAVQPYIAGAIKSAQQFLANRDNYWDDPSYLWIEKVTYSMPTVSLAYYIAASCIFQAAESWTADVRDLVAPLENLKKVSKFFSSLPMFKNHPLSERLLGLSTIEASCCAPRLLRARYDIFPHRDNGDDKYLDYIPLITVSCNNLGSPIHPQSLMDLMLLSMLNYQADEYMETVVRVHFGHDLQRIRELIVRVCRRDTKPKTGSKRRYEQCLETDLNEAISLQDVENVLSRFVGYVLDHQGVRQSAPTLRQQLSRELEAFLLAHVQQIEDNKRRFTAQSGSLNAAVLPGRTYFDWVRSTSAEHTSCPYSFVFWACLISEPGQSCFPNPEAKYLAQGLSRHLATICRQHNDYGSVTRDRSEGNLNSIDFQEFRDDRAARETSPPRESSNADVDGKRHEGEVETSRKKGYLLRLAEYERKCLELSLEELAKVCSKETMDAVRFFIRVTDLYGQIYVARDIGVRTQ
ncbi:MAG: hypothetical protein Q9201_001912 [Fulgogasparrea decipioides]